MATKKGVNHSNNKERCSAGNLDDLQYESIANQGTQTSVVWMFIDTSGKCAMYFDLEVRCVTDTC